MRLLERMRRWLNYEYTKFKIDTSGIERAETKFPCSICGEKTEHSCSNCKVDLGLCVFVCEKFHCRTKHEDHCVFHLQKKILARDQYAATLAGITGIISPDGLVTCLCCGKKYDIEKYIPKESKQATLVCAECREPMELYPHPQYGWKMPVIMSRERPN
jgi:transcription elongation factor Elf1